ncbi:hypothetical protein JHK85_003418 [Glycine max]|nr:hypothetical protein JHK85_003418 [Glycine max]KAG5079187.1 hypothetical protein JHK86_003252 [Glycine max]
MFLLCLEGALPNTMETSFCLLLCTIYNENVFPSKRLVKGSWRPSARSLPDVGGEKKLQRTSFSPCCRETHSQPVKNSEIVDNLLTLMIAGHTTTAAAMMWSVMFLHENRETQNVLREEQLSITKMKQGASIYHEDLNSMRYGLKVRVYTLKVMHLALNWKHLRQMFSNVKNQSVFYPANYRRAFIISLSGLMTMLLTIQVAITGYDIKKGWHVNIDATYIQRFDEMQKPYSFIPFGSGPRTCLGINMAKVTMLVFLHRLTGGYTGTLDDSDTCLEKKAHIPRIRSGCPITLKSLSKSMPEA